MAKKGETREVILDAAEKVFFQNGFEKTSVKMILEEAQIVTGSFYHFFPSKEALFEAVTERFLNAYAERIGGILGDESLSFRQIIRMIPEEMGRSAEIFYHVLQGDKLHWTVRNALHDRTLEAMVQPLAGALGRLKAKGEISSRLDAEDVTLARILIKGSEALIHTPKFHEGEMQKLEIQSTFNNMARIINSINAMYAARDFITDLKKKNVETYGGDQ